MNINPYVLLLVAIVIGVAGQLLLKFGIARRSGFRIVEIMGLLNNWPVLAGFGCYGISTILYFQVLANLELSLAYPMVSLGYVLVIVMSKLLFKKTVCPMRWAALTIICVGVALVGLGAN